jgi:hypothetical protein
VVTGSVHVDVVVDDGGDLVEGEPQILEGHHPVESGELLDGVAPVAGERIDGRRPEQADGVVVAQHPHRHAAGPGEVSDAET